MRYHDRLSIMAMNFLTGGDVAPIRKTGLGMFGGIAAHFRRVDVSFFNLELPLSERGEAVRGKRICHRGPPAGIDGMIETGVSCVNLANNHILDYGDGAMFDTIDLLDRHAIGHFGAGRNLGEARTGSIIEKSGLRVGFLGYTTTLPAGFAATSKAPGVNPLQAYTAYQPQASLLEYPATAPRIVSWTDPVHLQGLRDDIQSLRGRVNLVIVYVHWGASMSPRVHDFQREIGKAAIDAGAHAVFGGHQHVMSAIEFHLGCPIVHGSGNLLFDTRPSFFTDETLKTFLFGATITTDGLRDCHLLPVKAGVDVPPCLLSRSDPLWRVILDDLQEHGRAFGTEVVAREDGIEVRCG
ncbi:MAG: CapA family protein [Betaproteobacteria bacterium]|nr:CapA family protein [Betaproteobacteria bacterium]